ncbi:MAG: L,D-transpeptidase family protein [Clostridiales bacterium]|jgi:hypothetical protein|nr:L,D-transpeptidase family protein [Clostridiales bacterium]
MKRRRQQGMKRSYILILALLIGLAFTACKKNKDSDIQLDINPSNNSDEMNPVSEIDNIEESLGVDFDNAGENEEIVNWPESFIPYYVIGDVVRLREDASMESNTLDLLSIGTRVEYIDRKGDWIKVKYDDEIGYIRNDLLSETEPVEDTAEELIVTTENTSDAMGNSLEDIDNPKVIVKKADRILQLWDGDTMRASYPIGLGWEPIGDKKQEGDGKTPEGTYYVCTRNNVSRFYLSLGLSYPNKEDAYEGLEAGLINQGTYNQIENAIDREVQPPWNTALGGEIMIHGHGSHSDWTAGCIAVDNDIMDILWEYCRMGTPVIIEP